MYVFLYHYMYPRGNKKTRNTCCVHYPSISDLAHNISSDLTATSHKREDF